MPLRRKRNIGHNALRGQRIHQVPWLKLRAFLGQPFPQRVGFVPAHRKVRESKTRRQQQVSTARIPGESCFPRRLVECPSMEPVIPFGGARNHTTTDCRLDRCPSGDPSTKIRFTITQYSGATRDDAGTFRRDAQHLCRLFESYGEGNQCAFVRNPRENGEEAKNSGRAAVHV
jgi:hypothetical protein